MTEYLVSIVSDPEAGVWVATSSDIPGLVLESDSLDSLVQKVKYAAPELLDLNDQDEEELPLYLKVAA
jgi:predicted RNase H-like HicB family nuclease